MTIWVFGGEREPLFRSLNGTTFFKTAVAAKVTPEGIERIMEYRSPASCTSEPGSHLFGVPTIVGDTAYLCSQTEVLVCGFPDLSIRRVISLPCFNNLHHVTVGPDGCLYVAVTGLDAVARLSPEGELLELVDTSGCGTWGRFSPDVDYRKIASTKPHRSHPNYVFFLNGSAWVTRFEQRDAIPLYGGAEPIRIHTEGVHDGHVNGNWISFTSVDGHLIRFSLDDGGKEDIDLNVLAPEIGVPLGWCRGLSVDGDLAWIGFSRIRYTAIRRNLSWLSHGFRLTDEHRTLPTRVALYDLSRRRLLKEVNLESIGMGAVFGIHVSD